MALVQGVGIGKIIELLRPEEGRRARERDGCALCDDVWRAVQATPVDVTDIIAPVELVIDIPEPLARS